MLTISASPLWHCMYEQTTCLVCILTTTCANRLSLVMRGATRAVTTLGRSNSSTIFQSNRLYSNSFLRLWNKLIKFESAVYWKLLVVRKQSEWLHNVSILSVLCLQHCRERLHCHRNVWAVHFKYYIVHELCMVPQGVKYSWTMLEAADYTL